LIERKQNFMVFKPAEVPRISVLLVDDDESTRKTFSLIFTAKGFSIDTTALGSEALLKARDNKYDVALLDINLPDMKGIELISPLKKILPDATIFILTAHATVESAISSLNNGASAFFTKPINMDQVLAAVKDATEKNNLRREKEAAEENLKKVNSALRATLEINKALVRANDEIGLLEHACRVMVENASLSLAWAGFIGQDNLLVPVAFAGADKNLVNSIASLIFRSPKWDEVTHGHIKTIRNLETEFPDSDVIKVNNFKSMVILPLKAGNNTFGILNIITKNVEFRVDEYLPVAGDIADDLAYGIQALRTRYQLDYQRKTLESVYRIAINVDSTCESLCDLVAVNLSELLDMSSVVIRLSSKGNMRVMKFSNSEISKDFKVCMDSLCSLCDRSDAIVKLTGDLSARFPSCRECLGHDIHSFLGFPLKNHEGRIGSICLIDKKERWFGDEDIRLLEIFARYLRHEIEREEMEAELRQAQEMKILGQLASGVAHEVRNPLNAIQAIMEALILDLGDKTEYQPYLEHIKKQVKRLSLLMSDLLELGKPRAHFKLQAESCEHFFIHAVNFWKENSPHGKREVKIQYPQNLQKYSINIDPSKLQQVVVNILDNACQNSAEGEVIRVLVDVPDSDYVKIKFIDSGTGIKPEYLAHVFEPFFTMRKKGTGLGLTVVKHIIEVHGGFVSIYNNESGPGLTVEISLPVVVHNT
jgi:signal transduction histidine kinase/DNA-binding response OmpR family regulator